MVDRKPHWVLTKAGNLGQQAVGYQEQHMCVQRGVLLLGHAQRPSLPGGHLLGLLHAAAQHRRHKLGQADAAVLAIAM